MKNSEYKEKFQKEVFEYKGAEFVFNKSDRIGLLSNRIWEYTELKCMIKPSYSSLFLHENCICLVQHGNAINKNGEECIIEYHVPFAIAWEFWQDIKKNALEMKKKNAFIELKADLRDLRHLLNLPAISKEAILEKIERNISVLGDVEGF